VNLWSVNCDADLTCSSNSESYFCRIATINIVVNKQERVFIEVVAKWHMLKL